MGTRDTRVDAYITKSQDWARPILLHIREVLHAACPEVEETLKWSVPHYDYRGQMMCATAAFKEKVTLGFWRGPLIVGLGTGPDDVMENRGPLTSVKDLPSKKALTGLIKQAMKLTDDGITLERPKKAPKPEAAVPPELAKALAKNKKARTVFENFPPSHRREYCEWIGGAKAEETKAKRVAQAIEMMAEGKSRNWKYQKGA